MELRDRPSAVKVGVYWDGCAAEPAVRSFYEVREPGMECDGCRRPLPPGSRFVHYRPEEEESLFLCGGCGSFDANPAERKRPFVPQHPSAGGLLWAHLQRLRGGVIRLHLRIHVDSARQTPYQPIDRQIEFHQSPAKFRCYAGG